MRPLFFVSRETMLAQTMEWAMAMLRNLFAVISGLFAMMIVVTFIQLANIKFFYPPPPGMDFTNPEVIAAYAATMPWPALAIVVTSELAGAFVGAFAAASISREHKMACALAIGAVDMLSVAMNATSIPHPTWAIVAGIGLPLPLAWLAAKLSASVAQKGLANTR